VVTRFSSSRLPSAATLLAFLALLVALGGTSYAALKLPANSVGAKQLKKRAVTPAKVAPKTIAMFRGQMGVRGPAGAKGEPGARGEPGPKGDPGLARVTSRQADATGTGVVTAEASCNPGERLIGGGGISTSGSLAESESDAVDGGTPNTWIVTGVDDPSAGSFDVIAEALCAS
jgi:hypothetical protein